MVAIAQYIDWLNFPLITGGWVSRLHIRDSTSRAVPCPDALVVPTLGAYAARNIGAGRPMLEVVSAGGHQGSLQCGRPFLVGLGEAPDLVRGLAEIAEYRPEGLAVIDGRHHVGCDESEPEAVNGPDPVASGPPSSPSRPHGAARPGSVPVRIGKPNQPKQKGNSTMMTGFEFVILVFSIYVLTEIIRRIAAHRAIAKDKRSQGGADR
jgi:hypothetical protein